MPNPFVLLRAQNPGWARLARAERKGAVSSPRADPAWCSGWEVLALPPHKPGGCGRAELLLFASLRGDKARSVFTIFRPEPRELAGEPHSSTAEIRDFKFGSLGLFFFFNGFKVHVFLKLKLNQNVPADSKGNFSSHFPLWGVLKFGAFCSTSHWSLKIRNGTESSTLSTTLIARLI